MLPVVQVVNFISRWDVQRTGGMLRFWLWHGAAFVALSVKPAAWTFAGGQVSWSIQQAANVLNVSVGDIGTLWAALGNNVNVITDALPILRFFMSEVWQVRSLLRSVRSACCSIVRRCLW